MRKFITFIICLNVSFISFAQIFNNIDEIYPFYGDFAAIKKGNQWAFINKNGEKVINFRNDLVLSNVTTETTQPKPSSFPIFKDGRCLIKREIDGKYYYGYIDKKGNEVITPQYLNASNFLYGYAIIVKHLKDTIGYNEVLKKNVVSYKLEEYIIDTKGEIVKYLLTRNYIKSKNTLKIQSKFIAPHLIAVKNEDNKWDIYNF
ncbi:MAG: WG repeat-containing protein [Lutibacter sp.]|uniref:WG repeat-containing protein n=1 Tax=Lutibacter sp. TaxID=1925666 RepID=UPI00299DA74B|nr:WG repeat-containing protein [Lutibacter sp.]MDX1828992.1 WG repeat-containing protein [Lutibacter sp.]